MIQLPHKPARKAPLPSASGLQPYLKGHPAPAGSQAFTRETDSNGVTWLTFDQPDSPVNLWSEATLREFVWHVERLEHDSSCRALVIRSAKPRVFIAGADLKTLRNLHPARLEQLIWLGQAAFDRLARLPVPKIAMIDGACAGGGYEMALACDWRIASDRDCTRIGLPETQLGLIPGWGGTVRLPRLLGLRAALRVITGGRLYRARHALKAGLVSHVAPRERLGDLARKLVSAPLPRNRSHWDLLPGIAGLVARGAKRAVRAKTRGHYPAPELAVDTALATLRKPVDKALAIERAAVTSLARTRIAASLIDLFFMREAANKHRPAAGHALPVHSAVVVGAGVMGSGIAQAMATRGLRVLLADLSPDALAAGVARVHKITSRAAAKKALTRDEMSDAMDRLTTTHERVPLNRHPLVIEAATEDLEIKKKIFADLAARAAPDTILATNTSALSVAELAAAVPHPERVIGLHFFNPVHRMPLVEVIALPETHPDALATAVAFVQRLGKTPVLVKDSPGFAVNRVLMPYLLKAAQLHERGVDARVIDNAMLDFGMPMGPLRLLDEVGLDVAAHVAGTLSAAFPDRFQPTPALTRLLDHGKLGKKSGAGFYIYRDGKPVRPAQNGRESDSGVIRDSLSGLLTREAARVLEEGVVSSAEDLRLALTLGIGFPPFRELPSPTPETP
jgi:3-hydroxyacyl-CoA dehydrogenase/enoyl-CoA hydratase/3-hydroxybutyryl-CoA epimerase